MLATFDRLRKGERQLIVTVGDSITEQNYHAHGHLNYVGRFAEKLIETFGRRQFVFNAGISGDSATGVLARLERDALRFKPDLVTVMLGINDAKLGDENLPRFKEDYAAIIRVVRANGGEVLLLTQNCVDFDSGPAADVRRSYPGYVKAIRALAADLRAPLCDIHREWERGMEADPQLHARLMNDDLHPNEHGHRFIAERLCDYLQLD